MPASIQKLDLMLQPKLTRAKKKTNLWVEEALVKVIPHGKSVGARLMEHGVKVSIRSITVSLIRVPRSPFLLYDGFLQEFTDLSVHHEQKTLIGRGSAGYVDVSAAFRINGFL